MRGTPQQKFTYSSLETRWLPFWSVFPKTLAIVVSLMAFTWWRLRDHAIAMPTKNALLVAACVCVLYTVAQFAPFQLRHVGKPVTFAMTQYPLVIGILLLDPWLMCATVVVAALLPFLAGRRTFDRTVFNVGVFCFEIGIATVIIDWQNPDRALSHNQWGLCLLLIAICLAVSVVASTVHTAWQFREQPEFPPPSTVGIFALAAGMAATAGAISAACLHESLWPSPLVVAFMVALVKAYRIRQETTRRSKILTEFRNRTQESAISEDEVLQTLLEEACQITNARRAWIDFTNAEVHENIRIVNNDGPPTHGLNILGLRKDRATIVAPMKRGDGRAARLILAGKDPEWGDFTAADAATLEPLIGHAENKWRSTLLLSQIQHDSQFDDVTGIGNREYFVKALEAISEPSIVAQIRCKTLPRVVTAFGISVGNELAKELARRLTDAVSLCPSGIPARIADETFAFIIPETSRREMENMMSVMTAPLVNGPVSVNLSYSVGYTIVTREATPVEVLHQSHSALTTAMASNSHEMVAYRPADVHHMRHRMSLAEDLRIALQQGNITTAFQPKLNAETGIVCGFEALARWHHPRHGQIRPDEFTAIAEQTDQIRNLTQAVLRHALRACNRWQSVRPGVGVSINASTRDLMSPEFAATVEAALAEASLPSSLLTIEVTETDVISDPDTAVATLSALRACGVTVSVDDFGTGYSSLAYLQTLPIDEAKIDKSFIMQLDDDPTGQQFVARIISLMHSLNIAVTAEGVESAQTAKFLASAECDTLQGYYIARALPAHSVSTWLRDHGSSMIPGLNDENSEGASNEAGPAQLEPKPRMPMPRAATDEPLSSLHADQTDSPKPLTLAELDAGHVRPDNGIDPRFGSRTRAKQIPTAPPIAANAFLQGVTMNQETTTVTAPEPTSAEADERSAEQQSFVLGPPTLPRRTAASDLGEPVQLVSSSPDARPSTSSLPPAALPSGRARAVFEAETAQSSPDSPAPNQEQPPAAQSVSAPTPLMPVPPEHAPALPTFPSQETDTAQVRGSAVDANVGSSYPGAQVGQPGHSQAPTAPTHDRGASAPAVEQPHAVTSHMIPNQPGPVDEPATLGLPNVESTPVQGLSAPAQPITDTSSASPAGAAIESGTATSECDTTAPAPQEAPAAPVNAAPTQPDPTLEATAADTQVSSVESERTMLDKDVPAAAATVAENQGQPQATADTPLFTTLGYFDSPSEEPAMAVSEETSGNDTSMADFWSTPSTTPASDDSPIFAELQSASASNTQEALAPVAADQLPSAVIVTKPSPATPQPTSHECTDHTAATDADSQPEATGDAESDSAASFFTF